MSNFYLGEKIKKNYENIFYRSLKYLTKSKVKNVLGQKEYICQPNFTQSLFYIFLIKNLTLTLEKLIFCHTHSRELRCSRNTRNFLGIFVNISNIS